MYGFPSDLDLSSIIGQETTQFCVGPFDLQFDFGDVSFSVHSRIDILRNDEIISSWKEGNWPDSAFREIFESSVISYSVLNRDCLSLKFSNGLEMQLFDTSDKYESLQFGDKSGLYIV